MPYRTFLAVGCFTLSLAFWNYAQGATNPDLAALSQGSVVQFTGTEGISQPFAFDIELTASNPILNFANVVGQPLKIAISSERMIAGMIERIEQTGLSGRQGQYRIRIVPALKRLAYRRTNQTFAEVNAVEIATRLLNNAGLTNVESRLMAALPAKAITIQYQESDLALLSRLLEAEGIHYHFEPSGGQEKLVLGDSNAAFPVLPPGRLVFSPASTPSITGFSRGQAIHSGKVQVGDFNWQTPQSHPAGTAQAPQFANLAEDVFPAPVETQQGAQRLASIRIGVRTTEGQACRGESTYSQFQAGYRFVLAGYPRQDFNQEYVISSVEHHGHSNSYRNTFTCIPAHVTFRPSPITPLPVIAGVLPGIVVGPKGETKYVDQYGRVRVRFPWRNPAFSNKDEFGDSGWVRVAQIATGIGTTSMWIPDIGDEVVLAFEHGDPGRPVIVGSLWNGKDLPPASLPLNKFRSLFQSRSTSGVINEITFDETAGQERLIFRSGNQSLTLTPAGITATSPIRTPAIQPLRPSTIPQRPTFPSSPKQ